MNMEVGRGEDPINAFGKEIFLTLAGHHRICMGQPFQMFQL